MNTEISRTLLDWYAANARRLPWRGHPDAYAVWVSEIMLQQTRVETVIPYFEHWMVRFPTIPALAKASQQEVLQTWEGLGYYSRARNLQQAAQKLVLEYGGALPQSRKELEKLPGIGRYTAGAIASMAFGQDEAALDGNIRRVLSRLFAMRLPARSPQGEKRLWGLAEENLPSGRAGDFNQALMDLGTAICTPQRPACLICPLAELCQARAEGIQEELPVLEVKAPVPHIMVTAAIIQQDGKVLLARRPSHGLLGGMWEFPGGKQEPGEEMAEALKREIREELAAEIQVREPFGIYNHAYTHFKVTLYAFFCNLAGDACPTPLEASEIRWVTLPELADFPMGKIDRQIAHRLLENPDE